MESRRFRFRTLLAILAFTIVAIALRTPLVWAAGHCLVRDDGAAHAQAAVVLAGDFNGRRVLHGCEMVHRGFVPLVIVSGPRMIYGRAESDLAIDYAVAHGCPAAWMTAAEHDARSTQEEAVAIYSVLAARRITSFLLVTSDYHSRRAARIFASVARSVPNAPTMRTVAAPDLYIPGQGPWNLDRERQKSVFFELTKTVTSVFGI